VGLGIHFTATGVAETEREMLGISGRAYNMEPALHLIALDMRDDERELFATSGASSGEPWAELKESTLRRKAALGYPSAILIASSDLEASLTEQGGDHVEEITPFGLTFGTSVPYAGFHQKGAPNANIPQRKVLDFSELRIRAWTKTIQGYIVGVDRELFGAGAP
jgi:phage gpG-like protein